MPRIELEIRRQVIVERVESITVEVDVPQRVRDGELDEWVEKQLRDVNSKLSQAAVRNWDAEDETEQEEITEVNDLGPVG